MRNPTTVQKNKMVRKIRKISSIFSFWILLQIGVLYSTNTGGEIVITEFSLKTAGNVYQYIEIFNTTDGPIDLQGWKVEIDGIFLIK